MRFIECGSGGFPRILYDRPQQFRVAPCLSNASCGLVGRVAAENFRNVAHAGLLQVLAQWQ